MQVLKRGDDIRFLNSGGGLHRTVVMSVLGSDVIPARHDRPWVIDVDQAADWPGVRSGMWTEGQARAYVDYLFEFDGQEWARALGLAGSYRPVHGQRFHPDDSSDTRLCGPYTTDDGTP